MTRCPWLLTSARPTARIEARLGGLPLRSVGPVGSPGRLFLPGNPPTKFGLPSRLRVCWGMDPLKRITLEPDKRAGKPCIRGLRITVYDVLEYLASGMTEEEILADFPDLEPEDIRAVRAFAAARERRRHTAGR